MNRVDQCVHMVHQVTGNENKNKIESCNFPASVNPPDSLLFNGIVNVHLYKAALTPFQDQKWCGTVGFLCVFVFCWVFSFEVNQKYSSHVWYWLWKVAFVFCLFVHFFPFSLSPLFFHFSFQCFIHNTIHVHSTTLQWGTAD